jgi:superfamily II DNA/RNA helicase
MNENIQEIIKPLGIQSLNKMQEDVLASYPNFDELVILSNTGSGKTLAFLLPLLLNFDKENTHTQAMIIVPSRELALQIDEVFRKFNSGYKVTLCYGGHKREIEEQNLIQEPTLIIGTAGRIADHIRRKNINFFSIETLILDEYDKNLELGFTEEISFIVNSLKSVRKKILSSATIAKEIPDFIKISNPHIINHLVSADDIAFQKVEVKTLHTKEKDKINDLTSLLCFIGHKPTIVFCNHRDAVERVAKLLYEKGIQVSYYHGGMEQRERESELFAFKNGTSNLLITTDLASRGLDIKGVRYIIHYHLPATEDVYTHRNGRTARMDDFGTVVILLSPEEHLPTYITEEIEEIKFAENLPLPTKTEWSTLHVSLGKKDKVNKIDIVGFFGQRAKLKSDDIGLIEVKDFYAFVAIRKNKVSDVLRLIKDEKLKNKKVKIGNATAMVRNI